jgi:hypothetical protein
MTIELPMTEARRALLDQVRDGRITYADAAGRYCLDGVQVKGWTGRTLTALRRADYIAIVRGEGESTVDLTTRGGAALSG